MKYEPEKQRDFWNSRSVNWGVYNSPLVPDEHELGFQQRHLVSGGDTLILGVTPQLCTMALEVSNSVTAVDFSDNMINALRMDNVEYVCQDWIAFLENTAAQFDTVMTDGGLAFIQFPDDWTRLNDLIYEHLRPGGVFAQRMYLSTDTPPKQQYDNHNLMRFVPAMAHLDKDWMTKVTSYQNDIQYEAYYSFPPRDVVLQAYKKFTLIDEYVPDFEEGDRFISFAFQK